MVREHLTVPSASRAERAADFSTWVRDYQRGLLGFAQLIAGDPQTGEDLLQTALARAYLKWPKIGAVGAGSGELRPADHHQRERLVVAPRLEAPREIHVHAARAAAPPTTCPST